jgi:hypothetical protein
MAATSDDMRIALSTGNLSLLYYIDISNSDAPRFMTEEEKSSYLLTQLTVDFPQLDALQKEITQQVYLQTHFPSIFLNLFDPSTHSEIPRSLQKIIDAFHSRPFILNNRFTPDELAELAPLAGTLSLDDYIIKLERSRKTTPFSPLQYWSLLALLFARLSSESRCGTSGESIYFLRSLGEKCAKVAREHCPAPNHPALQAFINALAAPHVCSDQASASFSANFLRPLGFQEMVPQQFR